MAQMIPSTVSISLATDEADSAISSRLFLSPPVSVVSGKPSSLTKSPWSPEFSNEKSQSYTSRLSVNASSSPTVIPYTHISMEVLESSDTVGRRDVLQFGSRNEPSTNVNAQSYFHRKSLSPMPTSSESRRRSAEPLGSQVKRNDPSPILDSEVSFHRNSFSMSPLSPMPTSLESRRRSSEPLGSQVKRNDPSPMLDSQVSFNRNSFSMSPLSPMPTSSESRRRSIEPFGIQVETNDTSPILDAQSSSHRNAPSTSPPSPMPASLESCKRSIIPVSASKSLSVDTPAVVPIHLNPVSNYPVQNSNRAVKKKIVKSKSKPNIFNKCSSTPKLQLSISDTLPEEDSLNKIRRSSLSRLSSSSQFFHPDTFDIDVDTRPSPAAKNVVVSLGNDPRLKEKLMILAPTTEELWNRQISANVGVDGCQRLAMLTLNNHPHSSITSIVELPSNQTTESGIGERNLISYDDKLSIPRTTLPHSYGLRLWILFLYATTLIVSGTVIWVVMWRINSDINTYNTNSTLSAFSSFSTSVRASMQTVSVQLCKQVTSETLDRLLTLNESFRASIAFIIYQLQLQQVQVSNFTPPDVPNMQQLMWNMIRPNPVSSVSSRTGSLATVPQVFIATNTSKAIKPSMIGYDESDCYDSSDAKRTCVLMNNISANTNFSKLIADSTTGIVVPTNPIPSVRHPIVDVPYDPRIQPWFTAPFLKQNCVYSDINTFVTNSIVATLSCPISNVAVVGINLVLGSSLNNVFNIIHTYGNQNRQFMVQVGTSNGVNVDGFLIGASNGDVFNYDGSGFIQKIMSSKSSDNIIAAVASWFLSNSTLGFAAFPAQAIGSNSTAPFVVKTKINNRQRDFLINIFNFHIDPTNEGITWGIVTVVDTDEYFKEVIQSLNSSDVIINQESSNASSRNRIGLAISGTVSFIIITVFLIIVSIVVTLISEKLSQLRREIVAVSRLEFDSDYSKCSALNYFSPLLQNSNTTNQDQASIDVEDQSTVGAGVVVSSLKSTLWPILKHVHIRELEDIETALISMSRGLKSFGKFVPRSVVNRIVSGDPLGSTIFFELRNVTVVFSDIANFTKICEFTPMNILIYPFVEYMANMSNIIEETGGTVGDYMGDGIISYYGAPEICNGHAVKACASAILQIKMLAFLNEKWKGECPELWCRIGINTGNVFAGNLGSSNHLKYDIIGAEVNLASRLEGLNKIYGTSIIISDMTYQLVRHKFFCRKLDKVSVLGIDRPTEVYELICLLSETTDDVRQFVIQYEASLDMYLNGHFQEAEELFDIFLQDIGPDDNPALLIRERCISLNASPPNSEWNGVFVMTSK